MARVGWGLLVNSRFDFWGFWARLARVCYWIDYNFYCRYWNTG